MRFSSYYFFFSIVTTLFRRFWLKTGEMTHLRCNVCWEKFACDRTNDVLFSLEHVTEMSEEKTSGKRQVCAVHKFNRAKSPQERPVGGKKKSLAFMMLQAIFFSHKVEKTSYEMLTKHHSLDRFVSVQCMVSAAIICKYTCTNCFSSWLLKEQSSQCDLLKVDRKYQV